MTPSSIVALPVVVKFPSTVAPVLATTNTFACPATPNNILPSTEGILIFEVPLLIPDVFNPVN